MIENSALVKKPTPRDQPGSNSILQVFLNADCRYMLPGLVGLCKKNKIDLEKMNHGQLIVFLNTKRNYIKVIACNQTLSPVLACYRLPHGRIVDLSVVSELPKAFKGGSINYDEALRETLMKKLQK